MANRVILGNISGAYGLKISKPGFNVLTANDSDILFDSTTGFYRVRATYNFVFAANSNQQIVNHNIGTPPLLLWSISGSVAGTSNEGPVIFTTANQLVVGTPTGNSARNIKVHLLTEVV